MTPAPITAARNVNKLGAVLCSVFAIIPLFGAISLTRLFWGRANVAAFDWGIVAALYLAALAIGFLCLRLWRKPQWRGAWVTFRGDALTILVRTIWGREREFALAWSDIERITQIESPRGGSRIELRLTHEAGLRNGMVRASTRVDVSASRRVVIPVALVSDRGPAIVEKLRAAAEGADFRLVRARGVNLVVYENHAWDVVAA